MAQTYGIAVYGLFCACPECRSTRPGAIRYVGVTRQSLRTRFQQHLSFASREGAPGYNTPRSRWIRSHGAGNIRHFLLDERVLSLEDAAEIEGEWISQLETHISASGFNLSFGGEGVSSGKPAPRPGRAPGFRFSEESKRKMSESARRVYGSARKGSSALDEITVREIKEFIWRGGAPSDAADIYGVSRSAISHISNNRNWTHVAWPFGPRRRPQPIRPRTHSPETRKRMSQSHLARRSESQ